MITLKKMNAVTITIRDLQKSLEWYREKFGFETIYEDTPNSDSVIIGKSGIELALRQVKNPQNAYSVDTQNQLCMSILGFEVDETQLDRVEMEFPEDNNIIKLDNHPCYRSRIVEDPDGHAIELWSKKS